MKGWRLPRNTVCVTRPGLFGNPWRASSGNEASVQDAVRSFREWLLGRNPGELPERRSRLLARLHELVGKNVACYCPEHAAWCHGDVLMAAAAQLERTGKFP